MESFDIAPYGRSVVFLGGEIDMASAPELERDLVAYAEAGGPIVVDLSAVSFLDAAGLHALANAAQRLRMGCLILHGVYGPVAKVLDLVRLSDIANIHIQPCMVDPYPDGSTRVDGNSSADVAARLQSLRATFQRLHTTTEVSRRRTSEVLSAVRETRSQRGTQLAA